MDVPFSACWRELAAAYPDAPVLLSHRGDPEVRLRSMAATVLPRVREVLATPEDPVGPLFATVFRGASTAFDDRDALATAYQRWIEDVRHGVAPERLVEWQPGDGWAPLCRARDDHPA